MFIISLFKSRKKYLLNIEMKLGDLALEFMKENKTIMIVYAIIVLVLFPTESIVLSKLKGKLFSRIGEVGKKKGVKVLQNLILGIILLWLFVLITRSIKMKIQTRIYPRILVFLRSKLFKKTLARFENNYEDIPVGEHLARMEEVSYRIAVFCLSLINDIIPLTLVIIIINIYFAYVHKKIFLTTGMGLFLSAVVSLFFIPKCIEISRQRNASYLDINERIHDSYGNLMNIYLNNEAKREGEKYDFNLNKFSNVVSSSMLNNRNFVITLSAISFVTFATILIVNFKLYREGSISKTAFITIMMVASYYFGFLSRISTKVPDLIVTTGIIKHSEEILHDILNTEEKVATVPDDETLAGDIHIKNLSFRFPNTNNYIFKNLNLNIRNNENLAIVGRSGSGKSTLIKLILDLYPVQEGTITIGGRNVRDIGNERLRSHVTYVNQKTTMFEDSIINNIRKGNDASDEKIENLIEHYNLRSIFSDIEGNIYGNAGVHGGNLSLGMSKTIMILRGILRSEKIIVFDEPLAGLDADTRRKIITLIKERCRDKTVIIISHNKDLLPFVDRTIRLSDYSN